MHFAIQCVLAKNIDDQRLALRSTHLRYLEANKHHIFCGGPIVDSEGQPEMMLIILDVLDQPSAESFIDAEPYNRSGLFTQVTIREWRQVLPEVKPGALLDEIDRT
ncbi:MAG: YciI family protein [Leptolyngbya sp. BL-A-14]